MRVGEQVLRTEATFETTWEQLKAALDWIRQRLSESLDKPPDSETLTYTLESTGCYHLPVVLALGGVPRLVNPANAASTKRKTDVLDARLLAYHCIVGMWPPTFLVRTDVQALRVACQLRRRLTRERTRIWNTMNNTVLRWGHTFVAFSPLRGATGWSIMEDLIDGKLPMMPGVGPTPLPTCVRETLTFHRQRVDALNQQIRQAANNCLAIAKDCEFGVKGGELVRGSVLYPLLITHPGIGPLTALDWLSEVSDSDRFPSKLAVGAYCGLDPTLKVSAGHVTKHVRRAGNKILNMALLQAAKALINSRKEELGQWGYAMSKSKRQGGYKKAAGSVARRIGWALWAMHRNCEAYDKERCNYWRTQPVPDVPIAEMGLGRYAAVLESHGLRTSKDVAAAFQLDLASKKGVGQKCLEVVSQWLKRNQASSSGAKSRVVLDVKSARRLRRSSLTESQPLAR